MPERLFDQWLSRVVFDKTLQGLYKGDAARFIREYAGGFQGSFAIFVLSREELLDIKDNVSTFFKGRSQQTLRNVVEAYVNLNEEYLRDKPLIYTPSNEDFAYSLWKFGKLLRKLEIDSASAPLTRRLGLEKVSEFVIPGGTGASHEEIKAAIRKAYGEPKP